MKEEGRTEDKMKLMTANMTIALEQPIEKGNQEAALLFGTQLEMLELMKNIYRAKGYDQGCPGHWPKYIINDGQLHGNGPETSQNRVQCRCPVRETGEGQTGNQQKNSHFLEPQGQQRGTFEPGGPRI